MILHVSQCCKHTLAAIEAADTIGYNESAFLATVIVTPGNIRSNFC